MRLLRNNLNLGNEIDMEEKRKGNIGEDLFNAAAHNILFLRRAKLCQGCFDP